MSAKRYQAKLNLLAKVHKQVEPVIAAMRKAQDLLDGTSQSANGIENQGFVFDLAKYNVSYRMIERPQLDTPLASANDAWQSVRESAMGKAEKEFQPVLA